MLLEDAAEVVSLGSRDFRLSAVCKSSSNLGCGGVDTSGISELAECSLQLLLTSQSLATVLEERPELVETMTVTLTVLHRPLNLDCKSIYYRGLKF